MASGLLGRTGEITQLCGQDILKREGIWYMHLTPEASTLKTRKPRMVPLHEHLITQGFLDFIGERGKGALFYNALENAREGKPTNPSRPRAVKARERLAA
jgi:hypothetical protein